MMKLKIRSDELHFTLFFPLIIIKTKLIWKLFYKYNKLPKEEIDKIKKLTNEIYIMLKKYKKTNGKLMLVEIISDDIYLQIVI